MKRGETVLVGGIFAVLSITMVLGGVAMYRQGVEVDQLRNEAQGLTSENEKRLKELENEIVRHREQLSSISDAVFPTSKEEDARVEPQKSGSLESRTRTLELLRVEAPPALPVATPTLITLKDGKIIQLLRKTPEVLVMKPCRAKLVSTNPCTGVFEIENSPEVHLGGPFTSRPIVLFLRTLEKGKTYELPGAFIEFLDKGKWDLEPVGKTQNFVEETF